MQCINIAVYWTGNPKYACFLLIMLQQADLLKASSNVQKEVNLALT